MIIGCKCPFLRPGEIQSRMLNGNNGLWAQPIDATHGLNRSAGVFKSSVFLGRSFSCPATALSFA